MDNVSLQDKYTKLRTILAEMGSVVIGFSGGVDSTLLLKVACDVLGKHTLAVIGESETYPAREYEEAKRLAENLGARYCIVKTDETDDIKFKENPPDRCYYCKLELFGKLAVIAKEEGIAWIADGTNPDDLVDFRPGMKALRERDVRSPLLEAGLTKREIRELSRQLALPTWNKPSFACLASRFPYGFSIDREKLMKIGAAESFLRDAGFRCFRVRHHDERTIRIEVGKDELKQLLDKKLRSRLVRKMKDLGFTYITLDLEGYRTGSMNEVLTNEVKKQHIE